MEMNLHNYYVIAMHWICCKNLVETCQCFLCSAVFDPIFYLVKSIFYLLCVKKKLHGLKLEQIKLDMFLHKHELLQENMLNKIYSKILNKLWKELENSLFLFEIALFLLGLVFKYSGTIVNTRFQKFLPSTALKNLHYEDALISTFTHHQQ